MGGSQEVGAATPGRAFFFAAGAGAGAGAHVCPVGGGAATHAAAPQTRAPMGGRGPAQISAAPTCASRRSRSNSSRCTCTATVMLMSACKGRGGASGQVGACQGRETYTMCMSRRRQLRTTTSDHCSSSSSGIVRRQQHTHPPRSARCPQRRPPRCAPAGAPEARVCGGGGGTGAGKKPRCQLLWLSFPGGPASVKSTRGREVERSRIRKQVYRLNVIGDHSCGCRPWPLPAHPTRNATWAPKAVGAPAEAGSTRASQYRSVTPSSSCTGGPPAVHGGHQHRAGQGEGIWPPGSEPGSRSTPAHACILAFILPGGPGRRGGLHAAPVFCSSPACPGAAGCSRAAGHADQQARGRWAEGGEGERRRGGSL